MHEDNYGVYGARNVWAELLRHGVEVARCTVERLMRETGLRGLLRDKSPRTTRPAAETRRPGDLVKRSWRWQRRSTRSTKAELVRNRGPRRGLDDLEIATVEYIDWYDNQRLHGELGHLPPAEHERHYTR